MVSRARLSKSSLLPEFLFTAVCEKRRAAHSLRRGLSVLIASALLGAGAAAHADNIFQSVNTQLTASAGGQYTNYKESVQNSTLDSETGYQGSYQGKVSVQRDMLGIQDVYLSASFAYSKGRTDYDGGLQNILTGATIPYQASTRVYSTDIDVKVGKAFPFTPSGQIIYYAYYGYHQWLRDSTDKTYGYDEHYRHHSAGLGLIGQWAVTPKLVFSLEGQVGGTFAASMNADNVSGKFKLGSDLTEMGALGVDYAITRHVHVNAAYQISHFKYGASNFVDGGFYEPSSSTTNQTLRAGVGLAF